MFLRTNGTPASMPRALTPGVASYVLDTSNASNGVRSQQAWSTPATPAPAVKGRLFRSTRQAKADYTCRCDGCDHSCGRLGTEELGCRRLGHRRWSVDV
jgi:hypothetical protein